MRPTALSSTESYVQLSNVEINSRKMRMMGLNLITNGLQAIDRSRMHYFYALGQELDDGFAFKKIGLDQMWIQNLEMSFSIFMRV